MKTNVIVMVGIVIALLTTGSASAWLDTYAYRQSINLAGGLSPAQTDYQIDITIPYSVNMQPDFDDIRFTRADGSTLIDAWLETKTDSTSAVVCVEFPTTPANGVDQIYYMYYGNNTTASDWDIGTTFEYSDDYESVPNFIGADSDRSTGRARSPTHSLKLVGPPISSISIDEPIGSRRIAFWIYVPTTSGRLNTIIVLDKGGNSVTDSGCYLKFDSGIIYQFLSGAWTSTGISYTTGWHKCEITQHATTFDFAYDGASNNYSNLNTISEIDKLVYDEDGMNHYYDDIFVAKYVINPATYGFGVEEPMPPPYPETISYTWNSVSGTDDNVPADYGAMVTFFVADTMNTTTAWTFAVNGSLYQTGANNSCNVTFAEFGLHSVSVNGTGAYGVTPDHNWSVVCQRELASGSVETFPDNSEDVQDSISGEPSFEEFCKILVTPYTSVFGSIFYLFVFGTPLLMLYIRQDSLATPTTIMFLFGSMVLFMLPAQWQAIGGALMVLGLLGALFRLFKERER